MMRALMHVLAIGVFMAVAAIPASAVQPDEVLADPALEARARDISAKLRCMVCQNQSIDDSDADLAKDLRVLVRERLMAGDTDDEVIDFLVARYGEYVLLEPRFNLRNAALWAAPMVLLLGGGAVLLVMARRRSRPETVRLSAVEAEALENILKDR
ncbi:MAG: cytochrome c-type biogenesis protein [Rhizobiaceae bacterium]